ncbi:MAG: histidine ammonia-lyase [Planctomycetes bacterium]|nr:histidine ammonia-lyase [Planctomycetota bacterium]
MYTITLGEPSMSFDDLRAIVRDYPPGRSVRLRLSPAARRRMEGSRRIVEKALAAGRTVYGVNTGFGKLSDTRIDDDRLEELQTNLVLSHAAGLEPVASPQTAALLVALRAHSLALGLSGVTPSLVEYLIDLFNGSVVPVVPEVGSVGASGDLAPLAQLGAVLVGVGPTFHFEGGKPERRRVKTPYRFRPKEALSLVNGVQFTAAVLAETLVGAERTLRLADVAAAMSLEALKGSVRPFDERVQKARPHPGQSRVAANFRTLLRGSEVLESHRDCRKVQDAYCLRCIPQVHGAIRDAFDYARDVLLREVNSVTDNPLVFADGEIVSAGNFHGQPLALAADFLALSLASLANISERRIERMTNPDLSELPAFLVKDSGLNSGLMTVQVAAAAIAAEARVDAAPASVHSIPTGGAKEDHVPMAAFAARKCRRVLENVRRVLGLEVLCAAQGLDFLKPLRPGRGVEAAHGRVRRDIAFLERDRYLQPDIVAATNPFFLDEVVEAAGKLE